MDKGLIHEGMAVRSRDGAWLGVVGACDADNFVIQAEQSRLRSCGYDAVNRLENDELVLEETEEQVWARPEPSWEFPREAPASPDEFGTPNPIRENDFPPDRPNDPARSDSPTGGETTTESWPHTGSSEGADITGIPPIPHADVPDVTGTGPADNYEGDDSVWERSKRP